MPIELDVPSNMWPHIRQILEGEYDLPIELEKPTVLDIGANLGAFTAWAIARWAGATVHAYEPIPANYRILQRNMEKLKEQFPSTIYTYEMAVLGTDLKRRRMFLGKNNCGEASFHNLGEQSTSICKVQVVAASTLPIAEIIKIDTEGCELEILETLDLSKAKAVMLEVHRHRDLPRILDILHDFTLVTCRQMMRERWILKVTRDTHK